MCTGWPYQPHFSPVSLMFTLLPARSHMGTLFYCLSFPFLELQVWCVLQRKQLSLTQSTVLKHAWHCTYDEITYTSSGISNLSPSLERMPLECYCFFSSEMLQLISDGTALTIIFSQVSA